MRPESSSSAPSWRWSQRGASHQVGRREGGGVVESSGEGGGVREYVNYRRTEGQEAEEITLEKGGGENLRKRDLREKSGRWSPGFK